MADLGLNSSLDAVLGSWVQTQHLQPSAMAGLFREFDRRPERYLVVDDFLVPEHLRQIRRLLLEDGVSETFYKIYGNRDWVTKEQFEAAEESERFIRERIYVAPLPDRQMSPAVLIDRLFRREISGQGFHAWLTRITGLRIGTTGRINLKRLGSEHMLRWHSDGVKKRLLCAILYLHEDWRPDFGGRLLMQRRDGGIDAIEPLFNRLVLFDPQTRLNHAVEAITAGDDWARLNYTIWFYPPDEAEG